MSIDVAGDDCVWLGCQVIEACVDVVVFCGLWCICRVSWWDVDVCYVDVLALAEMYVSDL